MGVEGGGGGWGGARGEGGGGGGGGWEGGGVPKAAGEGRPGARGGGGRAQGWGGVGAEGREIGGGFRAGRPSGGGQRARSPGGGGLRWGGGPLGKVQAPWAWFGAGEGLKKGNCWRTQGPGSEGVFNKGVRHADPQVLTFLVPHRDGASVALGDCGGGERSLW